MPDFTYIARDLKGTRVTGTLAANSEAEAASVLAGRSLFPVRVTAEKPAAGSGWRFGRGVKGQVMAAAYGQIAALLRSGVPLLRSLKVIGEQSSNVVLKETLADIYSRVEDGATLADAMARHPRIFGEMTVNMVRAGGEGGFLEDALERIAEFTEQQDDLKSRTAGALAYPIVLAIVGTVVVSGLIIFFVPKFEPLFDSLRAAGELPILTEWLLWLSATIRYYGIVIALVGLGAAIGIRQWLSTERGRVRADGWRIRLPLAGPIYRDLAISRFCRVLGTMLKNGVPILKSLEISRGATGNRILSSAIAGATENITAGQSLATPLRSCGHFPATVVEMITVAEESNTLDSVLVQIAEGLEKRTARKLELVVRLIEPLMLLVLAMVVLFVVVALLMPVIKMSSTI